MARVGGAAYLLLAPPSPARGVLDFYVSAPLADALGVPGRGASSAAAFNVADLVLRDRMGGGNYGQVYEGVLLPRSDSDADDAATRRAATARNLPSDLKPRRVVLKRVNADGAGVRASFLRAGTIARGAAESGEAEAFFNARVARAGGHAAAGAARYLGQFTATESARGFTKGTRWLVSGKEGWCCGERRRDRKHKHSHLPPSPPSRSGPLNRTPPWPTPSPVAWAPPFPGL